MSVDVPVARFLRTTEQRQPQTAVHLEDARFRYPAAPEPTLKGVTMTVPSGQVVALLGPNGAGKSTLVNLLLGLNLPTSGTVSIFGDSPRQALRKGQIGAMLQSSRIADFVSIRELVDFIARQYRHPMPTAEVLELAGLSDKAASRVERLSGGEKQRVRFALTLVGRARLLILDEPTNEMDVASRYHFWEVVRAAAAAEGRTVFFTTHHMDEVDTAADRVVVMGGGILRANETPVALRARGGLPTITFRWRDRPDPDLLQHLTGAVVHESVGEVQVVRTANPDLTLRELVTRVPLAVDLKVVEASLDAAYLSLIGTDNGPSASPTA